MSRSIRIITTTTLVSLLSSGVALADDNLARGAKVRQSSTGFGGHAQRAVDGNTEGRYERNSVTHTQNGALAWLEVDLGQARKVGTVVVYNRTDCCAERLVGARVELGDEPCDRDALRVTRGLPLVGAGVAPRTELDFAATAARYLCVRLDTRDYLSVAEVEVFAPRAASATPAAMVGEYAARHPALGGLGLAARRRQLRARQRRPRRVELRRSGAHAALEELGPRAPGGPRRWPLRGGG